MAVIVALGPGAPAFAEDPPPPSAADLADKKAEARAHFDKARALAESGTWSAALAEFLASRRLYATWGNTLGAASSLQKLGRFDEALDLFEILLKEDGDTLAPDVRGAAQRQVVELRGLTGTVEISGAEIGASITIDGRDRGDYPAPGPLRVAAGSHLVRVSRQGFEPFETRADVAGGQTRRWSRTSTRWASRGASRSRRRAAGRSTCSSTATSLQDALGRIARGGRARGAPPRRGSPRTQPVSVPVRRDRTAPLTLRAEELTARIRVEPVPVNASVAIDAIVVARGIWEGRLRAGAHKVEVAAEGFSAGARDVTLDRDKQAVVAVTLQRDPRSPFWRRPPRPSHAVLEIDGAVPIAPSFGGDVAGGCAGAWQRRAGVGGYGVIRAGYELGSGFGFGASVGYIHVQEGVSGRAAALQPVGLPKTDPGTLDDTLAIREAGLAGLWGRLLGGRPLRVPRAPRRGGAARVVRRHADGHLHPPSARARATPSGRCSRRASPPSSTPRRRCAPGCASASTWSCPWGSRRSCSSPSRSRRGTARASSTPERTGSGPCGGAAGRQGRVHGRARRRRPVRFLDVDRVSNDRERSADRARPGLQRGARAARVGGYLRRPGPSSRGDQRRSARADSPQHLLRQTPAPGNGADAGAGTRPAASTAGATWKVCPRGMSFSCTQTSTGVPLEPARASSVCACTGARRLRSGVVQSAEGTWPDGSAKGRMTCADSDLPSARPPDPMP